MSRLLDGSRGKAATFLSVARKGGAFPHIKRQAAPNR